MILADTSIWVEHLRSNDPRLLDLLDDGQILAHPFINGEVALGGLRTRSSVMRLLDGLDEAVVARPVEVRAMIKADALAGTGVGYVDAHLLASARLTPCRIWTRDRRLFRVAEKLGLRGGPPLQ